MSNLVVNENLTLDGVMQSPSDPDEDRRGGFEHGGWAPLGSGRRLFSDGGPSAALRLVDTKTTTTGVVIATYHPAEPAAG
jgi:hypothetical protein